MTTTFPVEAPEDTTEVAATAPRPSRSERAGLVILLVATAVMYLWNITVNGMGNQFYAGSAAAGSKNWEALLFGSLDSANFITVDKPPVSQWVMGLSGQLFGFSSASMLIPEALMAVAAVALLYAAVTRLCGPRAGLLAGVALALTPVAALMFRFNNPDAAMVLLMTAAAYCTVRALERASGKWLAWAGVALGFAFLAKMLEGLMIAPALGLAYLVAAPTTPRVRCKHLLGAAAAFGVSAGWFVVLTLVWPASSRPYIAGSTDNNFMNLVLGYNGFARVLGHNHMTFGPGDPLGNSAGDQLRHPGGFGGMGQKEGLSRLFAGEFGFEIGWLVPAALLALVLVLIARGRAPRTDPVRAGVLLFGGWLVVDGLVLSYMKGMVHPYYCLSLAPAVAATVAIGAQEMWARRQSALGRAGLTMLIAVTGIWSWWVLGRNENWLPPLRWTILAVSVLAAVAFAISAPRRQRVTIVAAALGVVAVLAGPTAYAVATLGVAHHGGGPTVGPSRPAFGAQAFGQPQDNPQLDALLRATTSTWSAAISGSSAAAGLELSTGTAVMAIGGFTGRDPAPSLGQFKADVAAGKVGYYIVEKDWRGRAGGWPGTDRDHAAITDWVSATFPVTQIGDDDVYDLSKPK